MLRETINNNLVGRPQAESRGEGLKAAFMATILQSHEDPDI